MNEPQTLEQFRDFCKVLKLKIMKQKMMIEELEAKNNKLAQQVITLKRTPNTVQDKKQPITLASRTPIKDLNATPSGQSDRPEISSGNLKGKNEIMKILKAGVGRLGITPESIFRIADIAGRHEVEYDHFRNTLSQINLGLSPKQISTLIYMFDENCNSYITKDEFIQTLQGYQIAQEDPDASTLYKHICLQKLATIMNDDQINVSTFYNQLNLRKDGQVDMNIFEDQIKKNFEARIQEKQIVGAFYAMDMQRNGALDRQNFVYGINSSIKKIATIGPSSSRRIESAINQPQLAKTATGMSAIKKINNSESRVTVHNQPQNQESIINIKIPLESLTASDVLGRLKQESGVTLTNFYQQLCRVRMDRRTTLFNFKKTFNNIAHGQKPEMSLVSSLFKLIDFQQKGSIHYSQLLYFYLSQSSDVSIVLRLLGKYFHNNDLNCERFWFLFGISPDSDISKNRFIEVMCKTFEGLSGAQKFWQKLWNYFDKGRGVLPVTTLSHQMAKYQIVENVNS